MRYDCANHHRHENDCDWINRTELNRLPLAMAYVPVQSWEEPYCIMDGFHRGTIFPSLDKPFLGAGGCRR